MGTSDSDLFPDGSSGTRGMTAASGQQARGPPWQMMVPLLWAPVLYTARFAMKGRVQTATGTKIFIGLTLVGLGHAAYHMGRDSTM
jgi:hypothetical protein